jgi:3D (Asp-Asp-Asp) domain-containing protein
MIPVRTILFPWYLVPQDGTIAADTRYYPFGTRMYIPGYGWGVVEDRGGAIKGENRLDIFYNSHAEALQWGRRNVRVIIEFP